MLHYDAKEVDITNRCRQARIKRVQLMNEAAEHTVRYTFFTYLVA